MEIGGYSEYPHPHYLKVLDDCPVHFWKACLKLVVSVNPRLSEISSILKWVESRR